MFIVTGMDHRANTLVCICKDREDSGPENEKILGGGGIMESMREFNRVMEREIAKGDCPLRLEKIEIKTAEYKKIATEEKLTEVLSYLLRVGKFREYATKTVNDNVYMDRKGKQPVFIRTRSIIERNRLYGTIRRYGKTLAGDFDVPFYLETVQCFFSLPKEDMIKYRYTHEGKETYAFVLKDKYIKALYAHCLLSRKEAAVTADVTGLDELTAAIVTLDAVKNGLFQCLLMDDVTIVEEKICMNLYSIYLLAQKQL